MPLDFNLQRAEQCLFVHLKTPDDFSLVGEETGKGHDKLLRNARQEESTEFTEFLPGLSVGDRIKVNRSICTQDRRRDDQRHHWAHRWQAATGGFWEG
jgi:hypothetical protein